MPICSICQKHNETHNCLATLGSAIVCSFCLYNQTTLRTQKLHEYKTQLASAEQELRQSQGFFAMIFGNGDLGRKIHNLRTNIHQEKLSIVLRNTLAETVVDYPPDWELRREVVIKIQNGKCSGCSIHDNNSLHVHHINHLSRGGSNRLENLTALCRSCHSREHGGQKFQASEMHDYSGETALSKRTKSITEAIEQGKKVSFGYKKAGEIKYTRRRIKPTSLVTEKRKDGSSSVCVIGFCFTRNAERQFAINKMERLTVLKT